MAGYRPATKEEIIQILKKDGITYNPNANYGIRIYDPNYTEPEKKPLSLEEQAQVIKDELKKGTPRVSICSMLGLKNINDIEVVLQKADEVRLQNLEEYKKEVDKTSTSTPVQQNATLHSQQTSLVSNIEHVMQETIQQLTENKVLLTEQIDLLKRQVELLEKKLDDMQTTNQQLKQQINTLQSKGVNISQQGQQWEYKVIDPFRDGGCYELTEDGDAKLKKDNVNSSRSRMTDNDWNLLASASWEFILSYSGGYNGSDGYVLLRRPISVRRYYEQKRRERLDLEYQRKYNVF